MGRKRNSQDATIRELEREVDLAIKADDDLVSVNSEFDLSSPFVQLAKAYGRSSSEREGVDKLFSFMVERIDVPHSAVETARDEARDRLRMYHEISTRQRQTPMVGELEQGIEHPTPLDSSRFYQE